MKKEPNIIYVYADDLGKGMLSCYGQTHFQTPSIDNLTKHGIKFQSAYGCSFCAPARASLISGIHDCHAGGWSFTRSGIYKRLNVDMTLSDIYELVNNTGFNALEDTKYLPHILKEGGYYTGQIGKLEWGFSTSEADINKHGWDYHYGYYDHQQCHGFYPPFLFENGQVVNIEGNTYQDCGKNYDMESEENYKKRWDMTGKKQYSQDLFNEKIVEFIEKHKEESFFLFHPSQLPHGPISVPEIHEGVKNNLELSQFEKEYASMVLRLDDTVGIIVKTLEKYGLLDDTIIIFSSDNGHELYYKEEGRGSTDINTITGELFDEIDNSFTTETANDIFNGNGGLRGKKRSNCEGGVNIPYIISWKGKIEESQESTRLIANYDLMPTFAELVNVEMPSGKDGISFYKELIGEEDKEHEYVIYASHRGPGITTNDGWKLRYITSVKRFELYHLQNDPKEMNNILEQYPEKAKYLANILLKECDGNMENGTPFLHNAVMLDALL